MKWVFLLMMIVLTPVFISQFRSNPKALPIAGFIIGLGPFAVGPLHLFVAPISWPAWQGTVKGTEISLLDFVALALVLTSRPIAISWSLKLPVIIILIALAASTLVAEIMTPSLFYVWQFLRAVLLALAVARATARSSNFPLAVLSGYAVGMLYLGVSVAIEYGGGDIQAGGAFGHQNLAGLVTMFTIFPAFAILVSGRRIVAPMLILASEAVVAFGGGSRATIGLLGAGLILTLALSIWHERSGRKTAMAVATLVSIAIAAPIMYAAIERRPEAARQGSTDERRSFEDAAGLIVKDHPLGVGANRYVITANLGGYSDRAGVPWNYSERSAPVHNAYYLIAAEMGALGLIGYIALFGGLILTGLKTVKRKISSVSADMLVGLTGSAIVTAIYYAFEWVPMLWQVHYIAATNAGMLMGLAYALRGSAGATQQQRAMFRKPAEELVAA